MHGEPGLAKQMKVDFHVRLIAAWDLQIRRVQKTNGDTSTEGGLTPYNTYFV